MIEQQRVAQLGIEAIEFDENHSGSSPHIVTAITNRFLQVVVEVILVLIKNVLRISHENDQNVLGAIYSNVSMLIRSLSQNISKNFDALGVVEDAYNAQVRVFCHQMVAALHKFE